MRRRLLIVILFPLWLVACGESKQVRLSIDQRIWRLDKVRLPTRDEVIKSLDISADELEFVGAGLWGGPESPATERLK